MKRSGPAAVLFPLPTQEELAAMSEGEALNYLGEEIASPVFVEKLLEDEAAFASVEDFLETTMSGSAEPESRKRAAVLLHQDPGSLDFNNSSEVVDFLQALLPDIIPAGALASRQAFDELLSGFQAAWDGYRVFGNELGADPAVPEGVNLGDIARGQGPPLPAGAFEDPFAAGTPLQNILDAAGISL